MGSSQTRNWTCVPVLGGGFLSTAPSRRASQVASGKESACQCSRCRRHSFDPWVRKIPWRRKWQPTSVFLPGESHVQRSLVSCSPWGHKELNTTEHACTHHQGSPRYSFFKSYWVFKRKQYVFYTYNTSQFQLASFQMFKTPHVAAATVLDNTAQVDWFWWSVTLGICSNHNMCLGHNTTKVCIVTAMVFPVVMYGCENWTIKKSDRQKINAF